MRQLVNAAGIAKLERMLNYNARDEARDRKDGFISQASNLKREREGMLAAARQLNISCFCEPTAGVLVKGKKCVCGKSFTAMMERLQRLQRSERVARQKSLRRVDPYE